MKILVRFKWMIIAVLACLCAAAWLGMAAGIFWVKFSRPVWTAIVVSAAFSTEALFCFCAAALGVSAIQAQHRMTPNSSLPPHPHSHPDGAGLSRGHRVFIAPIVGIRPERAVRVECVTGQKSGRRIVLIECVR
jgi:hypothetical protein